MDSYTTATDEFKNKVVAIMIITWLCSWALAYMTVWNQLSQVVKLIKVLSLCSLSLPISFGTKDQ